MIVCVPHSKYNTYAEIVGKLHYKQYIKDGVGFPLSMVK